MNAAFRVVAGQFGVVTVKAWKYAPAKLLYVSFDSTIKANLSVGAPLDIQYYERDRLDCDPSRRVMANDPTFSTISDGWGDAIRKAFDLLPNVDLT